MFADNDGGDDDDDDEHEMILFLQAREVLLPNFPTGISVCTHPNAVGITSNIMLLLYTRVD